MSLGQTAPAGCFRRPRHWGIGQWVVAVLPGLCVVVALNGLTGCSREGASHSGLDRRLDPVPERAAAASALRWLDVADAPYAEGFRGPGFYEPGKNRRVKLEWASRGPTFRGKVTVRGLKPNFAYQLKLVGCAPVARDDPTPQALASRRLGELGRWTCAQDEANVADAQLRAQIEAGRDVRGYILFDFLVTDHKGNAEHEFALDSSYHVLWRSDQRERNRRDSAYRDVQVSRRDYGYGPDARLGVETIRLFAEKEEPRPRPGNIALPPGDYAVSFNMTEESFHANQREKVEGGGFWAQVLEGPIEFTITRQPPPGPHTQSRKAESR